MVDRKTVLTNLKNFYAWKFKNYPLNFDEAQVIIEALETETPHAKWEFIDGDCVMAKYKCSKCGEPFAYDCDYSNRFPNYCPQCGARMDGE